MDHGGQAIRAQVIPARKPAAAYRIINVPPRAGSINRVNIQIMNMNSNPEANEAVTTLREKFAGSTDSNPNTMEATKGITNDLISSFLISSSITCFTISRSHSQHTDMADLPGSP
jgi:hypothetical protein